MVAVSQNVPEDTTRISKFTLRGRHRNDSARWRSTGWTPLAYPVSALFEHSSISATNNYDSELNPFFPFDKDVLRASVRELLILDGSLDAATLTLKEELVRLECSDSRMTDVDCGLPDNHIQKRRKLDLKAHSRRHGETFCTNAELTDNRTDSTQQRLPWSRGVAKHTVKYGFPTCKGIKDHTTDQHSPQYAENVKRFMKTDKPSQVSSAAALVDHILERGRRKSVEGSWVTDLSSFSQNHSLPAQHVLEKPMHKVSDAEQISVSDVPPFLLDASYESSGDQVIARIVDCWNTKHQGIALPKHEMPTFLDVSIAFETSLRNAAYRILLNICASFDSEALRLFLGYKSTALKRERVLQILSDFLFDVSHAMFAWKQTESEILSEQTDSSLRTQTSFCQEVDSIVCDSLFDERALKKIGGLDDSSILRHAIEISRCNRRNEPWEQFAKTATGRRLLSHHRNGRAFVVGQKRRGQRVKRFSSSASSDASDDGPRSRASSIASYDEDENINRGLITDNVQQNSLPAQVTSCIIQNLSEVLEITLTRNVGESWGVLLSRESDMCVVERAPDYSSVRCGDMVLSVKNDRGESAAPPATIAQNDNPDWFKDVVNVFKGSNELRLVVRRVGCRGT